MVNNSTNINNINNHFSPQITEQKKKKKRDHGISRSKIQIRASDRHKNAAGLNRLMRSQHFSFLILYIVKILHIYTSPAA